MNLSYRNSEVIFVDNVSDDDSVNFVKTKYKDRLRIIENSVNNYTKGLNEAIKQSSSEYIFLVSNDAVVWKNCLDELVLAMENEPQIAIAQPKLLCYNQPKLIDCVGGTMDVYGNPVEIKRNRLNNPAEKGVVETLSIEAVYMIRKRALSQVGLFDEKFVIGYDDTDLALRVRLKGYKVVVVLQAVAYHHRGVTCVVPEVLVKIKGHFYKNRIATIIKNYEFANVAKTVPIAVFTYFFIMLTDLRKKDVALAKERVWALFWVLENLKYLVAERAFIQNYVRKVPDNSLKQLFGPNQLMVMLMDYSNLNKPRH
jgi:hypothetical protein